MSMTPEEHNDIATLLQSFGAYSLGEGNLNAGANLLAAMAVTLANLSREKSCIASSHLGRLHLGTDLLVTGSHLTRLVRDEILIEVATRQNKILANLRQMMLERSKDPVKTRKESEHTDFWEPDKTQELLKNCWNNNRLTDDQSKLLWSQLMTSSPQTRLESHILFPKFFVTASNSEELRRQLVGLHSNRPFISLNLNSERDGTDFSALCGQILLGLYGFEMGETVAGRMLVMDPLNVIGKTALNPKTGSSWLNQLVWLVDGKTEPCVQADVKALNKDTLEYFCKALSSVLTNRLNHLHDKPIVHEIDFAETQALWMEFLETMESRLPGIMGVAKNLAASLAFGLTEMGLLMYKKSDVFTSRQIFSFAKWIILRMVHTRKAMSMDDQRQLNLSEVEKIFQTIAERGKMHLRDIYRCRSLSSEQCKEFLHMMERGGLLRRVGNAWECAVDQIHQKIDFSRITIDV